MRLLPRVFQTKQRRKVVDLCIDGGAAVDRLLELRDFDHVTFSVPVALLTSRGGFGFAQWHPFVEELRQPGTLRQYYAAFQPKSLAELYFLEAEGRGAELSPRLIPWYENEFGDYSADPLHPNAFFGPAAPEILAKEEAALPALRRKMETEGFRPDKYGDIRGYILRKGEDVRFFLHGGRHRTACLVAMDHATIPVKLRRDVMPVIKPEQIDRWPFVARGTIEPEVAHAVFEQCFARSGSRHAGQFLSNARPSSVR